MKNQQQMSNNQQLIDTTSNTFVDIISAYKIEIRDKR